jgi:hypothetical protein
MVDQVDHFINKLINYTKIRYFKHVISAYLYELNLDMYNGGYLLPSVDGAFRVISLHDLPLIARHISDETYKLFESRLTARKDIMIAFIAKEGLLINWAWISSNRSYYEPIIDRDIIIPEDTVLLYDSRTLTRNLRVVQKAKKDTTKVNTASNDQPIVGVYESSIMNSIRVARELGKKKAIAVVVTNNSIPNYTLTELQFSITKRMVLIDIMGFKYHR